MGGKYSIVGNGIQTYDELPIKTYIVGYTKDDGCFLLEHPGINVTEKTYGVHNSKVKKVLASFKSFERSLGVILSGDKGIGKSIFAKILCEKAIEERYPVILVDEAFPGIARFIESIEQECIILFDEFDKTFKSDRDNDDQAKLLSLFDGTAGGKKLYIVTCNELYGLNDYIVNRPGRFHYHFRFEYPTSTDIREYLQDKLKEKYYNEIDHVIAFAQRISLNYDCLRAIAFELNQGITFSEAATDLNILNVNREEYNVILHFETGQTLHQYRFRTNLFDNEGSYTWVTMYDNKGQEILDVRYNKREIVYDITHNATIIPGDRLQLDFSDCDDEEQAKAYQNLKPSYISFTKCNAKSLHYII